MMDNTMISIREYWRNNQKWTKSREIGNIGHTRWIKTKQRHNTICAGSHHNLVKNTV
jgi:hypothetical protein